MKLAESELAETRPVFSGTRRSEAGRYLYKWPI